MMAAAIAWKHDGDEGHLLALPAEQRAILVELIEQAQKAEAATRQAL